MTKDWVMLAPILIHADPTPPHPSGLSLAHSGRTSEADSYFKAWMDEPEDAYGDLHLEVADALMAMGQHGRAVGFLEKLEVKWVPRDRESCKGALTTGLH